MRAYPLLVCLAMAISIQAQTQIIKNLSSYSSDGIVDSLKANANAVYRLDEGSLEIISASKYIYKIHNIITVLNKQASSHFSHVLGFDKLNKVESIDIKIYDSLGQKVAAFTKKDFAVKSADDGISLFTDDKLLYLETNPPSYPCTIETAYELRNSGYLGLPTWSIVLSGEAVEQSSFTVKVPAVLDIRYKMLHTNLEPNVTTLNDSKIYTWQAKNILPVSKPEADSYEAAYTPSIQLAPNNFDYDGYPGKMKDWRELGSWNYPLYNDEKGFTQSQKVEILRMVEDCKTDREKIKVLYDHLKKTMRYVSVQLGIGGFKPFPVQYVYEKKYGDCKALTNYMRYLLKTAGIMAYPALVNAGSYKPPVNPGFTGPYFNHVILCVPTGNDSVWLECTSNNNKAGVLGSFTENKHVLLLTEQGGVLISTPKSKSSNNQLNTKTVIELSEEGSSVVKSTLSCTGDFWNLFYEVDQYDIDTKKSIFTNYLHYKTPAEFRVQQGIDSSEAVSFNIDLSYDQSYNFKAGSKLFYDQRINGLIFENLKMTERKQDYLFNYPYQKTDTTVYVLPAALAVETLPLKKEISNKYVYYLSECLQKTGDNKLYVITHLDVKEKVVPAADYLKVAETFGQVVKNESQKIVLKKI